MEVGASSQRMQERTGGVSEVAEGSSQDQGEPERETDVGYLDIGGGTDCCSVDLSPSQEVNHVESEWGKVACTADSGAVDIVGPSSAAACVPTRQSKASRKGMYYVAANGTPIHNEGEKG